MFDSKSFEITFKTRLAGEQETQSQFEAFSQRLAESFAKAFEQSIGGVNQRILGLVDQYGQPMRSGVDAGAPGFGGASALGGATVTVPPPPIGSVGFSYGQAQFPGSIYAMAAGGSGPFSQLSQQLYHRANSQMFGPNFEMDMVAEEARTLTQLRKAGVKTGTTAADREQYRDQLEHARETLATGWESFRELNQKIKETIKEFGDLDSQLKDLKKRYQAGETGVGDQIAFLEDQQQQLADLRAQRQAMRSSIREGARYAEDLEKEAGPAASISTHSLVTGILGTAGAAFQFAGGLPLALARREAVGADIENMGSRALQQGDLSTLLVNQLLGGQQHLTEKAKGASLLRAGGAVLEGGAVGGGTLALLSLLTGGAAPLAIAGASAFGAGYEGIKQYLGFNENLQQEIGGRQFAEKLKKQEYFTAFSAAQQHALGGFGMARSLGDTQYNDFIASLTGMAGMTPGMSREARAQLIAAGGGGAIGAANMGQVDRMVAHGFGVAPTVTGQFFAGGSNTPSDLLYGMGGSAAGFMDRNSMLRFFGNVGGEAGAGLGATEGAAYRADAVMAAAEDAGEGSRGGLAALALQQQAGNLSQASAGGIAGWLGTYDALPKIAAQLGIDPSVLDMEDIMFINKFAGTMSADALTAHLKRKHPGLKIRNAGAAARTIQGSPFEGIQSLQGMVGGPNSPLGGIMFANLSGAKSAQEYEDALRGDLLGNLTRGGRPKGGAKPFEGAPGGTGAELANKLAEKETADTAAGMKRLNDAIAPLAEAMMHLKTVLESIPGVGSPVFGPSADLMMTTPQSRQPDLMKLHPFR